MPTVPDYVYRYASFLFSFLGRGVCEFQSFLGLAILFGSFLTRILSLRLRWIDPAARPRTAVHCRFYRWVCRSGIHCPRLHSFHRTSLQHA